MLYTFSVFLYNICKDIICVRLKPIVGIVVKVDCELHCICCAHSSANSVFK